MHDVYCPPDGPLVLLHHDRDLVAVDKPAGLLSVPGRRAGWQDSVELRLAQRLGGEQGGVWPVHRLDMDTSGVLLLALRRKAEQALRAQFAGRTVEKRYIAVVVGHPPDSGRIDLPLSRQGGWPPRNRVDAESGRPASTRFRVLSRVGAWGSSSSRLELIPETGRSHQLRVHLAALGHPILGDRFYAPPDVCAAAPRLLLHAARLVIDHPWSGRRLVIEAPVPF